MQKRKLWFGLAALAVAWGFDFLFWKQSGGISFFVWTAFLLLAGYVLAGIEKKKPSAWSIVLTVLILAYAFVSAWRSEMFTRFSSMVVALAGLLLLVTTFLDGYWPHYRFLDYIVNFCKSIWAALTRGFGLLNSTSQGTPPLPGQKTGFRRLGSVLLGIIIAVPVIALLGAILASADPIFKDMLQKVFALERIPEYLFRFTYIVIGAYLLLGLLLHAILPLKPAQKPDVQKAGLNPFLGWTECAIVLGAIDVLFITFVIVQIRYLFGGQANISATGYTYAEYARRGFGELVAVAVLTLIIYLVMHTVTKRESKAARIGFTVLSVVMLANVLVILASSLQRLLLYESAYDFSELRTYTHIFIFWLAGLILAAIILQIVNRQGRFGLALLVMILGFTASLAIVNVDGFVAGQNIQKAAADGKLDAQYLSTLSSDAVPIMVNAYLEKSSPADVQQQLGIQLACRTDAAKDPSQGAWQSLRISDWIAYNALQQDKSAWVQYTITRDVHGYRVVSMGDKTVSCDPYAMED